MNLFPYLCTQKNKTRLNNPMRKFKLILCMLSVVAVASAQTDSICGYVCDDKGAPLDYVNVLLGQASDSSMVQWAVTDAQGYFAMPRDARGGYLKASSMGYGTVYVNDLASSPVRIVLRQSDLMLGGVTVKGFRPSVKMTKEGFSTGVEGTPIAMAGSASDVLEQIPMVQKDGDNILVFGKGTPIVYVNGRRLRDLTELESIKSQDVKNVEVITNPGAKYDATVQSVIKIYTKKPVGEGFGADLTSYLRRSSVWRTKDMVALKYRKGRVELFDEVSYTGGEVKSYSDNIQTVLGTTDWTQQLHTDAHVVTKSMNNTFSCNVELAKDNFVGARYKTSFLIDYGQDADIRSTVNDNGDKEEFFTKNKAKEKSPAGHQLNVYYAGKVKDWDINLDIDYVNNKSTSENEYLESSNKGVNRRVSPVNDIRNSLFASRLVFEVPLWKGAFTYGAEYTYVSRKDDYVDETGNVPTTYSTLKEGNIMPFVEYSRMTPVGQLTLGVRNENAKFEYYDNGVKSDDKSRSYSQWFPSLTLGTRIGGVTTQLSFSGKTSRPSYRQLSNDMVYANRFTWQTGNPLLKPEYIYDFTVTTIWKKLMFNVSYKDVNDAIFYSGERMVYESTPVTKIAFENVPHWRMLVAYVNYSPTIGIWRPNVSLSLQKQFYTYNDGFVSRKLNKPIPYFDFRNNVMLGKDMIAYVSFVYQGKGNYQNMDENKDMSVLSVALTKTFMDGNLSVKIEGNDLFRGRRDGNLLYFPGMTIDNSNTHDSRYAAITVRYKFNQSKSKYKSQSAVERELNRL